MSNLERPTFDTHGFFEGAYDFVPCLRKEAGPVLPQYMPYIGRISLDIARPELYGFSAEIDKTLPNVRLPYHLTNSLKQIALQFKLGNPDRRAVPDAYSVIYARCGATRDGEHDITKTLQVDVMRQSLAEQLMGYDGHLGDHKRWSRVAAIGQPLGNAVLAFSTTSNSGRPYFGLQGSKYKNSGLKPVTSEGLAQAVFDTVYFWQ